MAYTSLALLKAHVRADDFSDDDVYLAHLLEAAETMVVRSTRRPLPWLLAKGAGRLPVELTQAILLLAGEWYATREAATQGEMKPIPYGVEALIKPFRNIIP
ncbi:MAG: head-tail connector protein [Pseudoflavonifractor sp.]|nr:head-tail connector protein [Alloprevotella sp.]MCM1117636.1 head-tail connector protein [Pseudoflavonifractor sp.]